MAQAPLASPTETGAASGDDTSGTGASQGYTIEISVDGSGSITVGVEPAADEADEASEGEGGQGENMTPVGSIKEALAWALEVYRNQGEAQPQDDSEDQMSQGFGGSGAGGGKGAA